MVSFGKERGELLSYLLAIQGLRDTKGECLRNPVLYDGAPSADSTNRSRAAGPSSIPSSSS